MRVRVIDLIQRADRLDCALVSVMGRSVMRKSAPRYDYYVLVDEQGHHVQVVDFTRTKGTKPMVTGRYIAALHTVFVPDLKLGA